MRVSIVNSATLAPRLLELVFREVPMKLGTKDEGVGGSSEKITGWRKSNSGRSALRLIRQGPCAAFGAAAHPHARTKVQGSRQETFSVRQVLSLPSAAGSE